MKVTVDNGMISVETPYNKHWVDRAKELGGRWNSPAWTFPEEREELVREALFDIYGENGRPTKKVTVDITLKVESYGRYYEVAGITFLKRRGRDWNVSCENGAIIVKGGFSSSGGSMANPRIGYPISDTVIRVSIPESKLGEIEGQYKVVEKTVSRCKLEQERAELLARLAEIDKLLGQEGE